MTISYKFLNGGMSGEREDQRRSVCYLDISGNMGIILKRRVPELCQQKEENLPDLANNISS